MVSIQAKYWNESILNTIYHPKLYLVSGLRDEKWKRLLKAAWQKG